MTLHLTSITGGGASFTPDELRMIWRALCDLRETALRDGRHNAAFLLVTAEMRRERRAATPTPSTSASRR